MAEKSDLKIIERYMRLATSIYCIDTELNSARYQRRNQTQTFCKRLKKKLVILGSVCISWYWLLLQITRQLSVSLFKTTDVHPVLQLLYGLMTVLFSGFWVLVFGFIIKRADAIILYVQLIRLHQRLDAKEIGRAHV